MAYVIYLYNLEAGIKRSQKETEEFYKIIKPIIIEILKEKGISIGGHKKIKSSNGLEVPDEQYERYKKYQYKRPDIYA